MRAVILLSIITAVCCLPLTSLSQDNDNSDQDYFVEAVVSDNAPFVGERIIYTFRFYARVLTTGINETLPDFAGFWLSGVLRTGDRRVTIEGSQYIVSEINAEISPLLNGDISIEPTTIILPETPFREAIRLQTNTIIVNVKSLPSDAPQAFNGAVGQFSAETTVDPMSVTLGEPAKLAITISGSGDLERLSAPDLPVISGWRAFSNPPRFVSSAVGGLDFGEKTFEWLLIPEQAGTQTFPAVIFSYFDPQNEEYYSLASSPFSIDVFPGDNNLTTLPSLFDSISDATAPLSLKPITLSSDDASLQPSLILWLLPPLVTCLCGFWILQKQLRDKKRAQDRQMHAINVAQKRLRQAGNMDTTSACKLIHMTILKYFEDKTSNTSIELKKIDVLDILNESHIQPEIASSILDCLEQSQAGQFIPRDYQQNINSLVNRTATSLSAIDSTWHS
jgi:hypothetical protein